MPVIRITVESVILFSTTFLLEQKWNWQMSDRNYETIEVLTRSVALGAFCGMALTGWLVYFDVSNLGTAAKMTADVASLSSLIVGGALLEGGLVGLMVGLATFDGTRRTISVSRRA